MADHSMPDLAELHRLMDKEPGTYFWYISEEGEYGLDVHRPGSLNVSLAVSTWFYRHGWWTPRIWERRWIDAKDLAPLTPEQVAEQAIILGREILEQVLADTPKIRRLDVNGLTNAEFSPRVAHRDC